MTRILLALTVVLGLAGSANAAAPQISGEYLESRTCDVYTGPCFANGQIGQAGREALLAWKVDQGQWAGVDLAGLGVALVVKGNDTLGFNKSFAVNPFPAESVILVDEKASSAQKDALVAFVKQTAGELAEHVVRIESVAISLTNDHLSGRGRFQAGKIAAIETRGMAKGDCVCSNETIFYPPLTKIENFQPAFALKTSFEGDGLDMTFTVLGGRSAFLGTFRR